MVYQIGQIVVLLLSATLMIVQPHPGVDYTNTVVVIRASSLLVMDFATWTPLQEISLIAAERHLKSIEENSLPRVSQGVVHLASQKVYLLYETWHALETEPQAAQIVQLDLMTERERLVYVRSGINGFLLSPDAAYALVTYYDGSIQRGVPPAVCLLTLATSVCRELDFNAQLKALNWIDSQFFSVISPAYNLLPQRIDAKQLMASPLNIPEDWYVYQIQTIPDTLQLLISAVPRGGSPIPILAILNLETQTLPTIEHLPVDDNTITDGDLSPDGRYLMYGASVRTLIDLETGTVTATFGNVAQQVWLAGGSGMLIQVGSEQESDRLFHIRLPVTETVFVADVADEEAISTILDYE